jgi:hypothetical protein
MSVCFQQALAVTQTLRSPRSSQLDTIVSIEKLLLQNVGSTKDGSGILAQVNSTILLIKIFQIPD